MDATSVKQLALLGGKAAVDLAAPTWPVVGDWEMGQMVEVVKGGKWSWLGPQEMAFCRDYAAFIGTKHCLCLANGTVTLQCALQAVGVEPGDDVIVPGMTWVATAQAALDIGANVVFADVDRETMCLDPASFESAITPKTRAVIPVHLYGCMCDMDEIMRISREHGIKVVEDTAHQHGSMWRDRRAGAIGDAGSYSFQQSKILTSGEGGAITCDDDDIYEVCFALKQVGWRPDRESPAAPGVAPKLVPGNHYGHNYRITEMQCVLLRAGLTRLDAQNRHREKAADRIRDGLSEMGGPLQVARRDERVTRQVYYALTLTFDPREADGLTRDQYRAVLCAEGVSVYPPYSPVYRNPLLNLYDRTSPIPYRDSSSIQDYRKLRLPATEAAADETALLLSHSHLLGGDDYIDQLIRGVRKVNDSLSAARDYFARQAKRE
ncbi:DegT/DnrJ/EryC1/StrS family aminotransferase [bacterium]|nr:DegT/DnrJ/EryC1/StrS family aminotransferase [bacterium]